MHREQYNNQSPWRVLRRRQKEKQRNMGKDRKNSKTQKDTKQFKSIAV